MKVGFKVALWFKNNDSFVEELSECLERIKLIIHYFYVYFNVSKVLMGVIHLLPVVILDNTYHDIFLKAIIWEYEHATVNESSRLQPRLLEPTFFSLHEYLHPESKEILSCVKATYPWVRVNVDQHISLIGIIFIRSKSFSQITSEVFFE